jgi:hypothetical protein
MRDSYTLYFDIFGMTQLQLFVSQHPFAEIALIVGLVVALSYLMQFLKQPLII